MEFRPFLDFYDKETELLVLEIPLTPEQAKLLQDRCIQGWNGGGLSYPLEAFYNEFQVEGNPI